VDWSNHVGSAGHPCPILKRHGYEQQQQQCGHLYQSSNAQALEPPALCRQVR